MESVNADVEQVMSNLDLILTYVTEIQSNLEILSDYMVANTPRSGCAESENPGEIMPGILKMIEEVSHF